MLSSILEDTSTVLISNLRHDSWSDASFFPFPHSSVVSALLSPDCVRDRTERICERKLDGNNNVRVGSEMNGSDLVEVMNVYYCILFVFCSVLYFVM